MLKYPDHYVGKVVCGDSLEVLNGIPDDQIDMCITSPPYWGLRDYGVTGQLGLEKTPEEYIVKLCDIFDEVKRVLKKTGTCWVNLGDTYGGSGGDSGKSIGRERKSPRGIDTRPVGIGGLGYPPSYYLMPKSLCLIPFRFALEMCNRGWILRNTIIWHKPNCMPSSVKDRFTVDFEYLFFFTKKGKYWFKQQFDDLSFIDRRGNQRIAYNGKLGHNREKLNVQPVDYFGQQAQGKNKRCVWRIVIQPFSEAHFAVFPEKLIETPILVGCSPSGIVLDPFIGSGTTGVVARKLGRDFIGIELNKEYVSMGQKRIEAVPESLFKGRN